MNLKNSLYITYSNQRKRELQKSELTGVFDKVITLDNLIKEFYDNESDKIIIDKVTSSSIIHKIIKDNDIIYFNYLNDDSNSIDTIFDFLTKCSRNEVQFKSIISGEKLIAIEKIYTEYVEYKNRHKLGDISDIEDYFETHYSKENFNKYDDLFIDSFTLNKLSFIKSKKQESILQKLNRDFNRIEKIEENPNNPQIIFPEVKVFDSTDEVKTSIKIARKLMEEGASDNEIIYVTTDIKKYSKLFKIYMPDFNMKGFSSIGTPLNNFCNKNSTEVRTAYNIAKNRIGDYENIFKTLGLKFTEQKREAILKETQIHDSKVGIEITEANQLVGLSKMYKHIIFIGADINSFPPQPSDNFLYTYDQDINLFYLNDYYQSSKELYMYLKSICDNLYLVTASYSGKKELAPSIVIDKENSNSNKIDVSGIKSKSDLALDGKAIKQESYTEYLQSISIDKITEYDGLNVKGFDARHLSASQINRYTTCPLQYLYLNKIRVEAPRAEKDGFDVLEEGSLMHLCFELFSKDVKNLENDTIDQGFLYDLMQNKSVEAYDIQKVAENRGEENIYHKLFLSNLQAGLNDDREPGLLAKFVDYYIENAVELNYFRSSEFEKEFKLDHELKPYNPPDADDNNHFIKGFIDRYDSLEEQVNILDYKSKKCNSKIDTDKTQEIKELKDIQLGLYLLYATQIESEDKNFFSSLLSFKGNNPYYHFAQMSTDEVKSSVLFDETYISNIKDLIFKTRDSINSGNFVFNNSNEKQCKWCDIKNICHQNILDKELEVSDE
ncbi:PD-(D/E)XK nuclease family protein [Thiospirochaeta perfilievii]|uniref:PD-(D/E)XK nuclease family protein n=1 Tax=Thiospirochaeta perfilievii TaxID=252967 RepID=A0A5C1Q9D5_9SPIO|nr:PD-(D/E)XK nuclease family protein [Thiospirochaeta perfilievii]QEN03406.1 PD-(D/E)XK nuclease family protein [Thiospirochaeta perfilievii]